MTATRRPQRIVKPSTRVERAHWGDGRHMVVGADAVGVACLSGPVLAAAVVMPAYGRRIPGVRDSKMLSRLQRERLYPRILRSAVAVGLGAASVAEIDRLNIYHATNLAMRRAICRIEERQHVLIDGLRVYRFEDFIGTYTAIVQGDARCYSIAAASIVAKVVRDRLMDRLATRYPHYGWEHNAGYATFDHRRGIEEHGITPFHRRSFARVRAIAVGEQLELELPPENLDSLLTGEAESLLELAAVSDG
ncbi:MAG TPA: ribonuclease HII [Candidatus Limnocylindria bacterium]|nr:ribonuclease HII [Candidatus Limnocylindria bacterium]